MNASVLHHHTLRSLTLRDITLTVLQWVEHRVACRAVRQPSQSGQDLLLVCCGIPLCYPPYTHCTSTCGSPPCRHVDRHVDAAPVQSPLAILNPHKAPTSGYILIILLASPGDLNIFVSFVRGMCSK